MTSLWRHHPVYGQSLAIGTASTGYFPQNTAEYPSNTGRPTGSGFLGLYTTVGLVGNGNYSPKHSIGARMFEQYRDGVQSGDTAAFISTEHDGASGLPYTSLKKGTAYYTNLTNHVSNFVTDAGAVDHEVDALHWIHGTSNGTTSQAVYLGYLEELQSDFDTDAKAITGQSTDIPITMSQHWANGTTISQLGPQLAALEAHRNGTGLFRLACPRYHLEINTASYPHLTGVGYYMLGEYHARALKPGFEPVAPIWIAIDGATITATFATTSQLAFDTTLVAAQTNYGFDYTDDGTTPAITDVSISGTSQVVITLASAPTGANPKLGYGRYVAGDATNSTDGWRGNLRDSDSTLSGWDVSPPNLYNWGVQFLDPIPYGNARSNATGINPTNLVGTGAGVLRRAI